MAVLSKKHRDRVFYLKKNLEALQKRRAGLDSHYPGSFIASLDTYVRELDELKNEEQAQASLDDIHAQILNHLSPYQSLFLPSDHMLIHLGLILGYEINIGGVCNGFMTMGLMNFLQSAQHLEGFKSALIASSHILNWLQQQTSLEEGRKKLDDYLAMRDVSTLTEDEKILREDYLQCRALLDGVMLAQNPQAHLENTGNQFSGFENSVDVLMPSEAMQEGSAPRYSHGLYGIYSKNDLLNLLRDFSKHCEASKIETPISMIMHFPGHAISCGYDPATKEWMIFAAGFDRINYPNTNTDIFARTQSLETLSDNLWANRRALGDLCPLHLRIVSRESDLENTNEIFSDWARVKNQEALLKGFKNSEIDPVLNGFRGLPGINENPLFKKMIEPYLKNNKPEHLRALSKAPILCMMIQIYEPGYFTRNDFIPQASEFDLLEESVKNDNLFLATMLMRRPDINTGRALTAARSLNIKHPIVEELEKRAPSFDLSEAVNQLLEKLQAGKTLFTDGKEQKELLIALAKNPVACEELDETVPGLLQSTLLQFDLKDGMGLQLFLTAAVKFNNPFLARQLAARTDVEPQMIQNVVRLIQSIKNAEAKPEVIKILTDAFQEKSNVNVPKSN